MSCPHPFSNATTGERPAGRFAPSPTSALHIGNLRTALAAWLLARCSDRRFVVRVEDLDQQRVAAAGGIADQQLRDLEDLGLDWDGPVVRQSERLDIYSDALAQLPTYPCFCTRREIAAAAQAPNGVQSWRPYPGTCRTLSRSDRQRRARVRPAAIRLASEVSGWQVTDHARGTCLGQVDDVVLRRNDGVYAYNLAVVVDDGVQGVDQVVRARDLWPSAARQSHLGHLLGLPEVRYAHCGLVHAPDGERLSKSAHAGGLAELAARGVELPRVRAALCESLGLPAVDDPHELLADPDVTAALTPPPTAPDPSGTPGTWDDPSSSRHSDAPTATPQPAASRHAPPQGKAPRPVDAGPYRDSESSSRLGWWSDWTAPTW